MKIVSVVNATTKQMKLWARYLNVDGLELARVDLGGGDVLVILYMVSLKRIIINIEKQG